jgi:flagellar biosynthetic protein FliR
MPWNLVPIYLQLPAFMLVLFRVGGLMFSAPMFGSNVIPIRIKAFFSIAIAIMVFPIVMPDLITELSLGMALIGILGELMIGLMLGFSLTLIFTGVQLGGQIIGQQAGIGLAEVFNPVLDSESTGISQIYFFVAFLIFLAVGGHHALVRAMLDSFATIPVMAYTFDATPVELISTLAKSAYGLSLQVAGPILIALFLTTLSLGFISRTVPQLNILAVGFTIRVMVALFVTAMTIALCQDVLTQKFDEAFAILRDALRLDQ